MQSSLRHSRERAAVLTKQGYKPRIVDETIRRHLNAFGAVCIEGPKWCGKTWTTLNHAESVFYVADPFGGFQNRQMAQLDAYRALEGARPHAIDEWQEVPELWDAVRFEADQTADKGLFLLTGSSIPLQRATMHSGAGRIARLRMRPMSLAESNESTGEISLEGLFAGETPRSASDTVLEDIVWYIVRGGWPASLDMDREDAMLLPRQYVNMIAESDMSRIDGIRRDTSKVEKLLRSLARNNQTSTASNTIIRDMQDSGDQSESLSRPTLASYLDALKRMYVIEDIPTWNPNMRSSKIVRTRPKRHFVDPSLAVAALRATPASLVKDLKTLGFMFETLATRDLKIYAESFGGKVFYYRDNSGLEADLVVEAPDGSWGAIEVKLGAHQADAAASTLKRFADKMVEKEGCNPPAFLSVICGLSRFGFLRPDGVSVVPLTSLTR